MKRIHFFTLFAAAIGLWAGIGAGPSPGTARAQGAPAANEPALVASIQELLTTLGYDAGRADGIAGQRTSQAIRAFQRRAGLDPDGRPSEALYHRLTAELNQDAAARSEPVPTPLTAIMPSAGVAAEPTPMTIGRWRITDEANGASIELALEPSGRVGGLATARFWRWERQGSTVRIFYDNGWGGRVVRTGRVAGDVIAGSALRSDGKRWSWRAERLPAPSGTEAAVWPAAARSPR